MDEVLFVWVNYPNEQRRNRLYSATVIDMYNREDPFVEGLTVPCWYRRTQSILNYHKFEEQQ